jgi:hypothetical protein
MEFNLEQLQVTHNQAEKRFEAALNEDDLALAAYRKDGSTYVFTHTEVPPAYEGLGIAGKVVKTALETVKAEGATMIPVCPYVKAYVKRHPEYEALIKSH